MPAAASSRSSASPTAALGEQQVDALAAVEDLQGDAAVMGDEGGVAEVAQDRQPRLKVLLTTGYAEASLERSDAGGSEFEVISKPYRSTLSLPSRISRAMPPSWATRVV
jgi:hypothetical protein